MTAAASAAALTDDEWHALWGGGSVSRGPQRLDHDARAERREAFRLARIAQEQRAEAYALGYAEETSAFYGSPRVAAADVVEQRLVLTQLLAEERAERAAAAGLPLLHGTAAAHAVCAGPGERRCDACRAYQTARSRANRAARAARGWCTGTRSSYDAGCRCEACTRANADGCSTYRSKARAMRP